jgi:hypothetical protein
MNDITIDHAQHLARHIVTSAIDDEATYRGGEAIISDTLCCFLEHRIAEVLRAHPHIDNHAYRKFDA